MSRHPSPSHRTNPNTISPFSVPEAPKSSPLTVDIYDAPATQVASVCSARRARHLALALLILTGLVGTLLFSLTYPVSQAQDAPDLWVTAAMRTPRNSHSLTELQDGRVLAAGGWDGIAPLASAELFDPAQRAWTLTGALSETRAYHTAARLPDGRVLVAGGWDLLGRPLTTTEIYDPAAGVWQPGAALAEGRAGHVAVSLPDGRILVAAGCGQGAEAVATAEIYDPAAALWQPAGALAEGRCWPSATRLADGRVLLVGGRGRDGQALARAELFDPTTNAWMPAGRLLTPRLEHTATLLPDGRVLVAGGYDGSGYLASTEIYDPATNAWTPAGELNTARANHAAVLLRDGRVLVAGGSAGGRPSLEAEVYDPASGRWTVAGTLPARYEAFLLTVLRDGNLLVTGRPDLDEALPVVTTPQPPRTPGPRGPTPTHQGAVGLDAAANDLAAGNVNSAAMGMAQAAAASTSNYTTGTQTARLFGVHEVSFTRTLPTPTGYNPYAETITVTFDPPGVGASGNLSVQAFYDGATNGQETWRARVYVNRVGTWGWTASTGASESFEADEAYGSGLHGMLRVSALATPSSTSPGSPKRWYTDDGRTFLPMADTQRQTGVNWQVTGMGAGSDYATDADGTVELTSADKGWIDVDVTAMAQAWVANPTDNHGLVLLPQAATGSVTYSFCSELGWTPCTQAQAPVLKVWHHQPPPPPTPEPTPEPES